LPKNDNLLTKQKNDLRVDINLKQYPHNSLSALRYLKPYLPIAVAVYYRLKPSTHVNKIWA